MMKYHSGQEPQVGDTVMFRGKTYTVTKVHSKIPFFNLVSLQGLLVPVSCALLFYIKRFRWHDPERDPLAELARVLGISDPFADLPKLHPTVPKEPLPKILWHRPLEIQRRSGEWLSARYVGSFVSNKKGQYILIVNIAFETKMCITVNFKGIPNRRKDHKRFIRVRNRNI